MTESSTPDWPDLAGRLTPRGHVLPVRVYFEDTDFSGVVYHGAYVRFFERGRSDFLRLVGGVGQGALDTGDGAAFAVRRMTLDFARPARIDDVLEVETTVAGLGGASLDLDQVIGRRGEVLVTASVRVGLVAGGKPRRFPEALRRAFGG